MISNILKVSTLTCSRWRLLKASTVSSGFRQQGVSHAVQRTLKKKYTTGPSEPEGGVGAFTLPPDFGVSVNPIKFRRQIMPTTLLFAPLNFQTFLRTCHLIIRYTVMLQGSMNWFSNHDNACNSLHT